MIQRGHRAGFAFKALREPRGGDFDRDLAVEAGVERLIHLAHASRANGRKDFVRAELVAGCQRHTL